MCNNNNNNNAYSVAVVYCMVNAGQSNMIITKKLHRVRTTVVVDGPGGEGDGCVCACVRARHEEGAKDARTTAAER